MPRLSANLSMLFTERPFLDRFRAAADAGFKAVEYMFPYEYEKQDLRERLADHQLVQALHNLPAGNWGGGDRGIACQPNRVVEFEAGVHQALEYANALGCRQVNCLAGIPPPEISAEQAREVFIRNLQFAAPRFKAAGIKLLIEAVNTRDVPGFLVSHTSQALDIIREVGSDNLFVQYDVYHMQVSEGDLAWTIERHLAQIAHIQLADTPGRHEPGTGEINFGFLLGFLDRIGYDGWVGCEYKPATTTEAGLGWAKKYLSV